MKKILRFFKEARIELSKVNWPGWDEVNRSTIIVLIAIILITFFIFFSDYIINIIIKGILS